MNIIEAEDQLKLLELKDDYNLNKENSLNDMQYPFICQVKRQIITLKVI